MIRQVELLLHEDHVGMWSKRWFPLEHDDLVEHPTLRPYQTPLLEQSVTVFQQRTTTLLKVLQLVPRSSSKSQLWWRSTTRERVRTLSLFICFVPPQRYRPPLHISSRFYYGFRATNTSHCMVLIMLPCHWGPSWLRESVTNSRTHFQRILVDGPSGWHNLFSSKRIWSFCFVKYSLLQNKQMSLPLSIHLLPVSRLVTLALSGSSWAADQLIGPDSDTHTHTQ